jgi:hypothetical protein
LNGTSSHRYTCKSVKKSRCELITHRRMIVDIQHLGKGNETTENNSRAERRFNNGLSLRGPEVSGSDRSWNLRCKLNEWHGMCSTGTKASVWNSHQDYPSGSLQHSNVIIACHMARNPSSIFDFLRGLAVLFGSFIYRRTVTQKLVSIQTDGAHILRFPEPVTFSLKLCVHQLSFLRSLLIAQVFCLRNSEQFT